jgi:hypothetical protein
MNMITPSAKHRVSVGGAPFGITSDHFAVAIVASAAVFGVNPIRALVNRGKERRAIAPALFALSSISGAPFAALTAIVELSTTDAYKSRKRASEDWQAAERAATLALRKVYVAPEMPKRSARTAPVEAEAPPVAPCHPAPAERPPEPRQAPPHNTGHALKPIVFRKGDGRPMASLPPIGERPLPDRIMEALGAGSLTTNTLAVILGAKELPVGDCLNNLLRSGEVSCEEFMDGHVRRRRWSRTA